MKNFIYSIQKHGKLFATAGFGHAFVLLLLCIAFKASKIELPAGNTLLYIACAIVGTLCLCIGWIGLTGIIKNNKE